MPADDSIRCTLSLCCTLFVDTTADHFNGLSTVHCTVADYLMPCTLSEPTEFQRTIHFSLFITLSVETTDDLLLSEFQSTITALHSTLLRCTETTEFQLPIHCALFCLWRRQPTFCCPVLFLEDRSDLLRCNYGRAGVMFLSWNWSVSTQWFKPFEASTD